MLLTNKKDLQLIYPQAQWDKIDTLVSGFDRVERTHLKKYLGNALIGRLNEDAKAYQEEGVQTARLSATDDNRWTLDILTACQYYIVHLYFANNVRIISTSFNRGGGANKAFADMYEALSDKELDSLSHDLYRRAMDDLEDLLVLLEEDAKADKVYTDLWSKCSYYYLHNNLLFPTATSLQPYYDIEERREKYQSLVPTIASAQSLHIVPNIGHKLFCSMLGLINESQEAIGESEEVRDESGEVRDESGEEPDESTRHHHHHHHHDENEEPIDDAEKQRQRRLVLNAALPDLLHSLANYVRAALCVEFKSQQERQQYQLAAKEHLNRCCIIICESADIMEDYIMGTPLDSVYASLYGKTLTQKKKEEHRRHHHHDKDECGCKCECDGGENYMLDLT